MSSERGQKYHSQGTRIGCYFFKIRNQKKSSWKLKTWSQKRKIKHKGWKISGGNFPDGRTKTKRWKVERKNKKKLDDQFRKLTP